MVQTDYLRFLRDVFGGLEVALLGERPVPSVDAQKAGPTVVVADVNPFRFSDSEVVRAKSVCTVVGHVVAPLPVVEFDDIIFALRVSVVKAVGVEEFYVSGMTILIARVLVASNENPLAVEVGRRGFGVVGVRHREVPEHGDVRRVREVEHVHAGVPVREVSYGLLQTGIVLYDDVVDVLIPASDVAVLKVPLLVPRVDQLKNACRPVELEHVHPGGAVQFDVFDREDVVGAADFVVPTVVEAGVVGESSGNRWVLRVGHVDGRDGSRQCSGRIFLRAWRWIGIVEQSRDGLFRVEHIVAVGARFEIHYRRRVVVVADERDEVHLGVPEVASVVGGVELRDVDDAHAPVVGRILRGEETDVRVVADDAHLGNAAVVRAVGRVRARRASLAETVIVEEFDIAR